jgi:hypothetical protein
MGSGMSTFPEHGERSQNLDRVEALFPEPTRVEDAGRLREVGIRQERLHSDSGTRDLDADSTCQRVSTATHST